MTNIFKYIEQQLPDTTTMIGITEILIGIYVLIALLHIGVLLSANHRYLDATTIVFGAVLWPAMIVLFIVVAVYNRV